MSHRRSVLRFAVPLVFAGIVAACSQIAARPSAGRDPHAASCPEVRVDRATASLERFNGRGTDITDRVFLARIVDYAGDCAFDRETGEAVLRFTALFAVTRGPAWTGDAGRFSYFVAIPAFYPSPAAKKTLPVEVTYPDGAFDTVFIGDQGARLTIPLNGRGADQTPVYIGFQLTAEDLERNRRRAVGQGAR